MKTRKLKIFALLIAAIISTGLINSQELSITHSTEGALEGEILASLDGAELSSITKLIITGKNLNATDATYLRTALKNNLKELDISGITFSEGNLTDKLCQQMTALQKVTLPNDLAVIGKYAFQTCNNLTEIKWKSIGNIDDYAFANCSKFYITSLPENINRIGQYGFSKCSKIEIDELPETLTGLGIRVFEFCPKLTIKEISPSITEIKERLFDRTGITDFIISDNVTKIGNLGFYAEQNPIRTFTCRREVAPVLGTTSFGVVNSISNTTINVLKKYADAYSAWEKEGMKLAYLIKNIEVSITGSGTVTVSGTGLVSEGSEVSNGTNISTYEGESIIVKISEEASVILDNDTITPNTEDNMTYTIPIGRENRNLNIVFSVISNVFNNNDNVPIYVNIINDILHVSGNIYTPVLIFGSSGNLIAKTAKNKINMYGFTPGVYIVKVNNKTFKIVK